VRKIWLRNYRIAALIVVLTPILFLLANCTEESENAWTANPAQRIRVRLVESADRITLAAGANPQVSVESQPGSRMLAVPKGGTIVGLDGNQWNIGGVEVGTGNMTFSPGSDEGIRINGTAYRGVIKFVALGDGKFDVINDLPVDDYLKGVVTKEMFSSWHGEALRSQAIVARTYALYEAHTGGLSRYWDVYPDQRSQMYGGIDGETPQGVAAVESTSGIVLTYGGGSGKIFKAYFSSCCGGVTQSVTDAFPGEPYLPPLAEHVNGTCCSASKYFNWGPITLPKTEIVRRIHAYAERRGAAEGRVVPEMQITGIAGLQVAAVNQFGRPSRVMLTDSRGVQYSMAAEEMRTAINTDPASGPTLPSSFCKIKTDPTSDSVTFYDGHGYGHGVGMCQYCAEAQAAAGQSCEQILASAYPKSSLVRAY